MARVDYTALDDAIVDTVTLRAPISAVALADELDRSRPGLRQGLASAADTTVKALLSRRLRVLSNRGALEMHTTRRHGEYGWALGDTAKP